MERVTFKEPKELALINTPSPFIVYDLCDEGLTGRKAFSLEEYGVNIDEYRGRWDEFDKKMEELELDKVDISPVYMFAGICGDDLLYAKIDRAVYQRENGDVSGAVWLDKGIMLNLGGMMCTNPEVEYYKSNMVEELDYIDKSLTDDIMAGGEEVQNLILYGNSFYKKVPGHSVIYLPAGMDDDCLYLYVVHVGQSVLVKEDGPDTVYGMYIATTNDGKYLLQKVLLHGGNKDDGAGETD